MSSIIVNQKVSPDKISRGKDGHLGAKTIEKCSIPKWLSIVLFTNMAACDVKCNQRIDRFYRKEKWKVNFCYNNNNNTNNDNNNNDNNNNNNITGAHLERATSIQRL